MKVCIEPLGQGSRYFTLFQNFSSIIQDCGCEKEDEKNRKAEMLKTCFDQPLAQDLAIAIEKQHGRFLPEGTSSTEFLAAYWTLWKTFLNGDQNSERNENYFETLAKAATMLHHSFHNEFVKEVILAFLCEVERRAIYEEKGGLYYAV